jgi:superfamily II DNA or RNA helicase
MIILRDYQKKIIEGVRESFQKGNKRVILQSEVGAGKTFISCEIMRLAIEKRQRVLFIAPRRQLIYQTVEALEQFDIQCGVIMAGVTPFSMPLVQVASFDTITSRVSNGRMALPQADLVIADEAHMMFSKARIDILKAYPRVLGLTATPTLANGNGMGELYDDIVEGMPMGEMISKNHLVPMRYFIGEAPDLSDAKLNKDGDYTEKSLMDANDKPALIGSIYENWERIAGDRCTLIFAVNCKHAVHLHNEFLSHGVVSEYIDGMTEQQDRESIKNNVMSGKTQVVINIGVMVAGVSWDRFDCIVMARQTRSVSQWRQCLGRGSRNYPGKKETLVIYHGDNFEELGRLDDPIEWSLDSKESVKERIKKAKEEGKEPKEITCGECGTIFRSRRDCPACSHEMISKGEPIPYHEAELVEVKAFKPKPVEKAQFYAEMLGYCHDKGKKTSYALAIFKQKFDSWPNKKHGVQAVKPSKETLSYIKSCNIAYARSRSAA